MNIPIVDKGIGSSAALFTPHDQSLYFRPVLSFSPLSRCIEQPLIRLMDLRFGRPSRRAVLPVAHYLGFDPVKGIMMPEIHNKAHSKEHRRT